MIELPDQQLQQLQLYCRHKVDHLLCGHYRSAFKGQGVEFDEVRLYSPGDDVRSIDWNVTARSGEVHIKRFQEEREINLLLVVDNSPSFAWSSSIVSRRQVAAQFCGLLGTAALRNSDRIGLLRFSDGIDSYQPPARGRSQLMRCLTQLLLPAKKVEQTKLTPVLDHLNQLALKRSIIVLLSDFFSEHFLQSLSILGRRHQVLAIALDDERENSASGGGLMRVRDAETSASHIVDWSSAALQQQFSQQMQNRQALRAIQFADSGIDLLSHNLSQDPVSSLLRYFQTRRLRVEGETGG